jgi:hypothetical protein
LNTNIRGAQPSNELAKEAKMGSPACRLSCIRQWWQAERRQPAHAKKEGDMQRQTLSNFTDQCQFSKMMAKKSLWNEYYYYTTK